MPLQVLIIVAISTVCFLVAAYQVAIGKAVLRGPKPFVIREENPVKFWFAISGWLFVSAGGVMMVLSH